MTSQLLRFLLVLFCVTICLSTGISGEDVVKKEAVSAQTKNSINKFAEDDVKFNVVKREANPDAKARRRKNRQIKKNESMKKRKRKNKNENKKDARKIRQGNKKRTTKRRQGNKNRKRNKGQGSKKRKRKIRRGKNFFSHMGRKIKKKHTRKTGTKKKKSRHNHKGLNKAKLTNRQTLCTNAREATLTISDGIKTYRKYFNHYKTINRTIKCLDKLVGKSELPKLKRFNDSAEWLENVTTDNHKFCPGSPINNSDVIKTIYELKKCGSADVTDNPILYNCTKDRIKNVEDLIAAQNKCIDGVGSPPYNSYGAWNTGFQNCFQATPPDNCNCYKDLNQNNKVYNGNIYSCKSPATPPPDWINTFNTEAKNTCTKCTKAVQKCKSWETKAANLTSICCKTSLVGDVVTTVGAGRRMMIKASMMKKLQKINIK